MPVSVPWNTGLRGVPVHHGRGAVAGAVVLMTEDALMGAPQSPSDKSSYRRQPRRWVGEGGTLRRPSRGQDNKTPSRGRLFRCGETWSQMRLGQVNRRPRKHCRAAVPAAICNQLIRLWDIANLLKMAVAEWLPSFNSVRGPMEKLRIM